MEADVVENGTKTCPPLITEAVLLLFLTPHLTPRCPDFLTMFNSLVSSLYDPSHLRSSCGASIHRDGQHTRCHTLPPGSPTRPLHDHHL